MAACDHGAGYASCPPKKVSHEFNQADKGTSMLRNAMKRLRNRVGYAFGGNVGVGGPMMPGAQPAVGGGNPFSMFQNGNTPRPMPMGPAPNPNAAMPQGGMPMAGPATPTVFPKGPMPQTGMNTTAMMGPQGPPQGVLGSLAARPMPPPAPTPMARPPTANPSMFNPSRFSMPYRGGLMRARGGGIQPPSMGPSPLPPQGALGSLIGQGMAGRHAGFPGPRKPRIPLPGQLRNINQPINHLRRV